jgi:hypothetical protein
MMAEVVVTSEQKQAKLEALREAIIRICPNCKDDAQSGRKTLRGSPDKLYHMLPGDEITVCKAGPLHLMMLEISQQATDQESPDR